MGFVGHDRHCSSHWRVPDGMQGCCTGSKHAPLRSPEALGRWLWDGRQRVAKRTFLAGAFCSQRDCVQKQELALTARLSSLQMLCRLTLS